MELPLKPIPKTTQDPKNLIIYGAPKVESALQYSNILCILGKNGKTLKKFIKNVVKKT